MNPKLLNQTREESLYVTRAGVPAWQLIYQRLKLSNISNVTSYQVNGNLYIVVPVGKEGE